MLISVYVIRSIRASLVVPKQDFITETANSGLMQLVGSLCRLVGNLLLLGNGERVDTEVIANAGNDEPSPAEVDNHGKDEVCPKVEQLELGADLRKAKSRQVSEKSTTNKRIQHDSPPGERLACQVSENNLGC